MVAATVSGSERRPERPLRFCLFGNDNEFIPPDVRDCCASKSDSVRGRPTDCQRGSRRGRRWLAARAGVAGGKSETRAAKSESGGGTPSGDSGREAE